MLCTTAINTSDTIRTQTDSGRTPLHVWGRPPPGYVTGKRGAVTTIQPLTPQECHQSGNRLINRRACRKKQSLVNLAVSDIPCKLQTKLNVALHILELISTYLHSVSVAFRPTLRHFDNTNYLRAVHTTTPFKPIRTNPCIVWTAL